MIFCGGVLEADAPSAGDGSTGEQKTLFARRGLCCDWSVAPCSKISWRDTSCPCAGQGWRRAVCVGRVETVAVRPERDRRKAEGRCGMGVADGVRPGAGGDCGVHGKTEGLSGAVGAAPGLKQVP